MDENRRQAYGLVLSAGLLHLKWDLACLTGGFAWFNPRRAIAQIHAACRASDWARTFHNLAIFASQEFSGFSEDTFWDEIEQFKREHPDAICPYQNIFDRSLCGDEVHIVAPNG